MEDGGGWGGRLATAGRTRAGAKQQAWGGVYISGDAGSHRHSSTFAPCCVYEVLAVPVGASGRGHEAPRLRVPRGRGERLAGSRELPARTVSCAGSPRADESPLSRGESMRKHHV